MEPAPGFTRSEEGMQGHPDGRYYMPPECDVPLRRGWFYHPSEDGQLRSVAELTGIYLRSVGCGGYLNLGLAPMPDGRLADGDANGKRRLTLCSRTRSYNAKCR